MSKYPGLISRCREDRGWEGWRIEFGVPLCMALVYLGFVAFCLWVLS